MSKDQFQYTKNGSYNHQIIPHHLPTSHMEVHTNTILNAKLEACMVTVEINCPSIAMLP